MKGLRLQYLGDDPDFIQNVKQYISVESKDTILCSSLDTPIHSCAKSEPHIVFIDFSMPIAMQPYIEQIVFLKKTSKYKPVLFVALFSDEEQLRKFDYIFHLDFN